MTGLKRIRFMMVGGFLGAGKTTTIAALAKYYQSHGLAVGIVTNDQAADLVDTHLLRERGFDVSEVAGSCFCCNFDGLQNAIGSLAQDCRPDIILAEPVGSCTDLIATIALPMQDMLGERFIISPYAVILKPSHGRKILSKSSHGGFSPQAAYIFNKQLEEADILLVNRIDELEPAAIEELERLLEESFPGKPVRRISAKVDNGIAELAEQLLIEARSARDLMEVDYDVYAEGEAELGWLNATCQMHGETPCSLDELSMALITSIQQRCITQQAEIAHLKIVAESSVASTVVNAVNNDQPPLLSIPSHEYASNIRFVINARVSIDPEKLQAMVMDSIAEIANENTMTHETSVRCFRPGRPVPTHRVEG